MKAAVCQFPVTLDVERNVESIVTLSTQAADGGARIAVFAECALSGYPYPESEALAALDPEALATGLERVREAARRDGIWIVAGSTHVRDDGARLNSAYVVNSAGVLVARYDKRILFAHERSFYRRGGQCVTFELEGIRFGVLICYEMQFFELYREYKSLGVDCMIHPKYSLPEYEVDPLEDVEPADAISPAVHAVYNRMTILCPNESTAGGSSVYYPDGSEERAPAEAMVAQVVDVRRQSGPRRRIDLDRDGLLGHTNGGIRR